MENYNHKRIIALVMLVFVAIVWGAGFVLADGLLASGFHSVPGLQNTLRFGIGAIAVVIFMWKYIDLRGKNLLYGAVGGALLFAGFLLQLIGQKHITPAHSGFFTASYFILMPFATWIVYKRKPNIFVVVAVTLAVIGMLVLNWGQMPNSDETLGTLLTISSAIMFGLQIMWADWLLSNKKITDNNLAVLQLVVSALLFALYTLIFESHQYSTLKINWNSAWWQLAIVALLGTGYAYFAQTFAQQIVSPAQTSLILACECPIGAVISIFVGTDDFSWKIVIGGALITVAVVLIELIPQWQNRKKKFANIPTNTQDEQINQNDLDSAKSQMKDMFTALEQEGTK